MHAWCAQLEEIHAGGGGRAAEIVAVAVDVVEFGGDAGCQQPQLLLRRVQNLVAEAQVAVDAAAGDLVGNVLAVQYQLFWSAFSASPCNESSAA